MFMKLIVHLRTSSSKFENASSRKKEYILIVLLNIHHVYF